MNDPQRKFARLLSFFTLLAAIAMPLTAVGIWLYWDHLAPIAAGNLSEAFNLHGLSTMERLAGFSISMVGALIQAYGYLGLRQTFREAAVGRALSALAIRGFRRFAWITLISVLIGVIQRTLWIVIFSISDATQDGRIDIQLGSGELKALFVGLLLVFVAHVFVEGKRAKDENESFI